MIDLRDLKFLAALARHGHFARAAQECGVSQPAFSMRIRRLEERLGVTIVRRGNRFEGLTAEGEAALRHARAILDEVRAMEETFRSGRGEISGPLRLGVIPTAAASAAHMVQRLVQQFPGITPRIETASSLAIQQGIEDGRFDAGLTYADGVAGDLLSVLPHYRESYVLLAPDRLAPVEPGQPVPWAAAAALPLVLLEPGMQNRRILDGVFDQLGLRPQVVAETSGFTAAMVLAVDGGMATVVPGVLADAMGAPPGTGVFALIEPVVEKTVSLVTPLRRPGLPTVAALLQSVTTEG